MQLTPARSSPTLFFALVFGLSVPFWLAGSIAERFLPGTIPIQLPFSALMFVCPLVAAVFLTHRESGASGVKSLFKRVFDIQGVKEPYWFGIAFLLLPAILLLGYALKKLGGIPVSDLQIPDWKVAASFVPFFIAAIAEELGWQGYACEPLQARRSALATGLILGTIWAAWHIIPYTQGHNSPIWILWQCLFTIATRVLIVWIFNNTGKSLFLAITFHAMSNVSSLVLPNYGLAYDPFTAAILTSLAVLMVTLVWTAKTLSSPIFSFNHKKT